MGDFNSLMQDMENDDLDKTYKEIVSIYKKNRYCNGKRYRSLKKRINELTDEQKDYIVNELKMQLIFESQYLKLITILFLAFFIACLVMQDYVIRYSFFTFILVFIVGSGIYSMALFIVHISKMKFQYLYNLFN